MDITKGDENSIVDSQMQTCQTLHTHLGHHFVDLLSPRVPCVCCLAL